MVTDSEHCRDIISNLHIYLFNLLFLHHQMKMFEAALKVFMGVKKQRRYLHFFCI